MNIHTSLNKFIFFLPNFIFQKAIYTSCILFVFIFCYMHIKLFVVVNVSCVLFHFFHAIIKFCVVFVVGIIKRAIPVNYGRTSTEITKLHTTPTRVSWRVVVYQCVYVLPFVYVFVCVCVCVL